MKGIGDKKQSMKPPEENKVDFFHLYANPEVEESQYDSSIKKFYGSFVKSKWGPHARKQSVNVQDTSNTLPQLIDYDQTKTMQKYGLIYSLKND